MSADYRRMVWQVRANRWAVRARWIAILLVFPEVWALIAFHFPLWDDVALPLTFAVHQVAGKVQQYTEAYRAALDLSALEPLE